MELETRIKELKLGHANEAPKMMKDVGMLAVVSTRNVRLQNWPLVSHVGISCSLDLMVENSTSGPNTNR